LRSAFGAEPFRLFADTGEVSGKPCRATLRQACAPIAVCNGRGIAMLLPVLIASSEIA